MGKRTRSMFLALLSGGLATAYVGGPALAEWKPAKPVEFVVMAGKGGGADKAVRFLQAIIALRSGINFVSFKLKIIG